MKASVIIPNRRPRPTLRRTLESLDAAVRHWRDGAAATEEREVEFVVSEDDEGRGPSWARNRGLDRASGDYVFFCDDDDTVRPDFFARPIAALERTGADLCLFSGEGLIVREPGECRGLDAVRARHLPAFFGYSFDDVRRWLDGGRLDAKKEPGSVCLAAFRRDFLERCNIRFDETLDFYEDAAFLSCACAFATHTVTIADVLYDYAPAAAGNLATGYRQRRHRDYKFKALAFRRRLDERTQGAVWRYCEASCVFSALELRWHPVEFGRYLRDPLVRKAFKEFPWSIRMLFKGVPR